MRPLAAKLLHTGAGFVVGVALTFAWLARGPSVPHSTRSEPDIVRESPGVQEATQRPASESPQAEETPTGERPGVVLDSDISWVNRRMTERVNRLVESVMAERDAEYELLFSEIGLDGATREAVKYQIAQLYRRKKEAGIILSELLTAQMELERHMKTLSPSALESYLAFEDATMAREEVANIARFAQGSGLAVSGDELLRLQAAIQRERAYTMRTLGGPGSPFDEIVIPFGGRSVIPKMESLHREMSASSTGVLVASRGFDDRLQKLLEQYYADELAAYQKSIQRAVDFGYGKK